MFFEIFSSLRWSLWDRSTHVGFSLCGKQCSPSLNCTFSVLLPTMHCTIAEKTLNKSFYTIDAMHDHSKPDFSVWGHNRAATCDYHIDLSINYASLFSQDFFSQRNSSDNAIFPLAQLKSFILTCIARTGLFDHASEKYWIHQISPNAVFHQSPKSR